MSAEQEVLAITGIKRYLAKLPSDREREWFRRHLRKYIQMYLPDCPFEITTTNRYTVTIHEAAIGARRFVKQGQEIKYLSGTLVPMTPEEELDLDCTRKDFSIVMSSRRKTPSFFLGPARFANHDCNANARLVTRGSEGMQVVSTRNIYIGEEITVSYGDDYFGADNCECLCLTCERNFRNGWSPRVDSERQGDSRADSDQPHVASETRGDSTIPHAGNGNVLVDGSSSPSKKRLHSDTDSEDPTVLNARKSGKSESQGSSAKGEPSIPEVTASIESAPDAYHANNTIPEVRIPEGRLGEQTIPGITNNANVESNGGLEASVSNGCLTAAPTDSESPPSLMTDGSQPSSTSTPQTSVCGTAVKLHSEEDGDRKSTPVYPDHSRSDQSTTKPHSASNGTDRVPKQSNSKDAHDEPGAVAEPRKKRKYQRRKYPVPLIENELSHARVPGDYIKTPRLLALPYDRWVECQTCDSWFVQRNSYLTRRECPRCERHSVLYGFRWPKTDKEGPLDNEERVMDHRTIHRFLHLKEDSQIPRKGRGVSSGNTPTPVVSDGQTEAEAGSGNDDEQNTRTTRRQTRQIRVMT